MRVDIYDLPSNQLIDYFEPTEKEHRGLCGYLDDEDCISRVVDRDATKVSATTLGEALVKKLARYRGGPATPYTVTFNYFDRREAVAIIAVMADEFPGYKDHRVIRTDQGVRKYAYITTAKPTKMEEWLTILLADMNFDPDKEIRIAIDGTGITVEKIVPTPDRPRSADEKAIFK